MKTITAFDFEPRIPADMPIWARLLLAKAGVPFAAVTWWAALTPGHAQAFTDQTAVNLFRR
jgi:hypothetical protein